MTAHSMMVQSTMHMVPGTRSEPIDAVSQYVRGDNLAGDYMYHVAPCICMETILHSEAYQARPLTPCNPISCSSRTQRSL